MPTSLSANCLLQGAFGHPGVAKDAIAMPINPDEQSRRLTLFAVKASTQGMRPWHRVSPFSAHPAWQAPGVTTKTVASLTGHHGREPPSCRWTVRLTPWGAVLCG